MERKNINYCSNCNWHHGSSNFSLYKCPNCNYLVCNHCKKGHNLCDCCRKANYVKVR